MSQNPSTKEPNTMFAWQCIPSGRGIEHDLRFNPTAQLPTMSTSGSKAKIKVLRASLNPADYKLYELPVFPRLIGTPITPCTGFVGRVVESASQDLEVGALVLGNLRVYPRLGSLSEYVVAGPKDVLVKLDHILEPTVDQFAGLDAAALTALYTLRGMKQGEKVFINGSSGGTGTFGVQIAKAMGLEVVASCSTRNVDLVKNLGADKVIDYTRQNLIQELQKDAERTGRLCNRIIHNVSSGTSELYFKSHMFLDQRGSFNYVGMGTSLSLSLETLKMVLLPGFFGGGKRKLVLPTTPLTSDLVQELVDMVVKRNLKTVVQDVVELADVPRAFSKLKSGRVVGKLIVAVSNDDTQH